LRYLKLLSRGCLCQSYSYAQKNLYRTISIGIQKIRAGRKPSSVPWLPRVVIIYLGRRLPFSTSDLPGSLRRAVLTPDCSGDASLCDLAPGGVFQALPVARGSGGLLPHRFTLTLFGAVFFSVALSMGSPPVPFRDRLALRSSDFPPSVAGERSPNPL
jgi:hypothetical protein